jgi:hypothetical protein
VSSFTATVVSLLFWPLAAAALVVRLPLALFLFVILAHLDPSGGELASAQSIGVGNLVKGFVLPLVFLARSDLRVADWRSWPFALRLWALLCLYAALLILPSPYKLAGLKMVAYLGTYLVLFLVYSHAWARGEITLTAVRASVWVVVGLAVVQSYLLGNAYGTVEGRFTTFVAPQSFAAFMLPALALLLTCGGRRPGNLLAVSTALVAIVLSGSRYVLAGTVLCLALLAVAYALSGRTVGIRSRRLVAGVAMLFVGLGALAAAANIFSIGRVVNLTERGNGSSDPGAAGTLFWRFGIYLMAYNHITHRELSQDVVGFGTSTGAVLFRSAYPAVEDRAIDANRIVHNEFLRAFYEWGAIGLALLLGTFVTTAIFVLRSYQRHRSSYYLAAVVTLPLLFGGLLIENVLSGAAMPNGVGAVLVLGAAWGTELQRRAWLASLEESAATQIVEPA